MTLGALVRRARRAGVAVMGIIAPDFCPGGSYYTELLTAGTITTLP